MCVIVVFFRAPAAFVAAPPVHDHVADGSQSSASSLSHGGRETRVRPIPNAKVSTVTRRVLPLRGLLSGSTTYSIYLVEAYSWAALE